MVVVLRSVVVPDFLIAEINESTSFPFFEKKIALIGLQINENTARLSTPQMVQAWPIGLFTIAWWEENSSDPVLS
jgi:hypothetical protein